MDLMERAAAGQLSDFELSKMREIILLYVNHEAADDAIRSFPEGDFDYRSLRERVAIRQYKFLGMNATIKKTGLSRSTIERMEKEGTFPRRVTLSDSRKGWHSHDIYMWMQSRCIVEGINTSPYYREEDRKENLKFPNILRLYGLHRAVERMVNSPDFPKHCYANDGTEDDDE